MKTVYHNFYLKRKDKTLTKNWGSQRFVRSTQKMRRRSPARWWREQVSEVEAQRAHWKPGVHGALGEPIHDLIAGVCVSQETYWLQREMGKSFLPPCLFWFSLFKTLSWAQLRASSLTRKEHHQQTWTMAGLGHSLSAIPMWIFPAPFKVLLTLSKSPGPASVWGPGSSPLTGSWLRLFSSRQPLLDYA